MRSLIKGEDCNCKPVHSAQPNAATRVGERPRARDVTRARNADGRRTALSDVRGASRPTRREPGAADRVSVCRPRARSGLACRRRLDAPSAGRAKAARLRCSTAACRRQSSGRMCAARIALSTLAGDWDVGLRDAATVRRCPRAPSPSHHRPRRRPRQAAPAATAEAAHRRCTAAERARASADRVRASLGLLRSAASSPLHSRGDRRHRLPSVAQSEHKVSTK